jgi:heme/copper-type cytochrome/quinol oxidase subunit 4
MAEVTHTEITEHAHDNHAPSDTVVILGYKLTVTGGIYTVGFVALGVITLLEVFTAEVLKSAILASSDGSFLTMIKAILLLGMAIVKSALVILFYMHLKDDNRILAVVLLLPLLIALLSVMFVLAIPPTGYHV